MTKKYKLKKSDNYNIEDIITGISDTDISKLPAKDKKILNKRYKDFLENISLYIDAGYVIRWDKKKGKEKIQENVKFSDVMNDKHIYALKNIVKDTVAKINTLSRHKYKAKIVENIELKLDGIKRNLDNKRIGDCLVEYGKIVGKLQGVEDYLIVDEYKFNEFREIYNDILKAIDPIKKLDPEQYKAYKESVEKTFDNKKYSREIYINPKNFSKKIEKYKDLQKSFSIFITPNRKIYVELGNNPYKVCEADKKGNVINLHKNQIRKILGKLYNGKVPQGLSHNIYDHITERCKKELLRKI